jgi:SpoVK/Ycf46/Vps4 family AAA+-type ATPase
MSSEEEITNDQELPALSQYYAARLLVCSAVHPSLLAKRQRPEDTIAEILGWEEKEVEEADVDALRTSLRVMYKILENDVRADVQLQRNTQILRKELGLSDLEVQILLFACLVKHDDLVSTVANCIRTRSRNQLIRVVASAIGQPISAVRGALATDARLMRSGLLANLASYRHCDLEDALGVNETLGEALLDREMSREDLCRQFSRPAPAPLMSVDDYPQIESEVSFLLDLLKGASNKQAKGVNILLYGLPGTGKTQLARTLVNAAGLYAAETIDQNDEQDAMSASQRLSSYAIGQRLLSASNNTAIIFDEVEEILDSEEAMQLSLMGTQSKRASNMKSWKNRLLEENQIPTIWIANQVRRVDDALLRRFTYSLKLSIPPRSRRAQMIANAFGPYQLSQKVLDNMADQPNLTPADIERTLKAINLAGTPEDEAEDRIALALCGRHDGVQLKRRKANSFATLPYNPEWIHTKPTLDEAAALLSQRKEGRLLFSGPPGTGKTAFAEHLATSLDAPLLLKRASDLISPYIGETERLIMEAFKEAQKESAVLFIDEADTFLQDRRNAQRSWELSQVNELLTQIDHHDGYLILATNFADRLDAALSRRIDLKVEFQRLTNSSGRRAIYAAGESMGISVVAIKKSLSDSRIPVSELALGDIVAAMRQAQLRSVTPDASLLIQALHSELEARGDHNNHPMGFTH